MDYKYINQLLERYWECQTTLEEEDILRTFFSQDDIPASLLQYRDLFVYAATEPKADVLGQDFDDRIIAMTGEETQVKAKIVPLRQRMMPLFKAAAVVAILLTLGNAMQMSMDSNRSFDGTAGAGAPNVQGVNMAKSDSVKADSLHRTSLSPQESQAMTPIYE